MFPIHQKIVPKDYNFSLPANEQSAGLVTYSASDNDTSKETVHSNKTEVNIRVNTSYRKRIEEDLKSFKLHGDIEIKNPECDDESLVRIMRDIPNKYSLRAYESEDEFDAVKISLCQKEVSCVDDINVLYGTEEKSDYYQKTIDHKFANSTYLQWKPIIYDEMDSQDSESELSDDEENDDEIPTEGEESAKDDDDKCRMETNKYEDSHTNDTTPSLDHAIDDSETETASENGPINENNNETSTAAEDNCEHSPSEDEQNTDGKTVDEYEDDYLDEDESDEKDVDQKNTSVKDTTRSVHMKIMTLM